MLICIDDSVGDMIRSGSVGDDLITALLSLAHSFKRKENFLISSFETLVLINGLDGLDVVSKKVYRYLHSKLAMIGSVHKYFSFYCSIVADGECRVDCVDGIGVVYLPINLFGKDFSVGKPVLLCEDLEDCKFFSFVGQWYAANAKLSFFDQALIHDGGGGNNTARKFHDYVNALDRFCLCILDSDVKSPKGRIGSTARRVVDEYDVEDNCLCCIKMLDCREVENLIPISGYENIANGYTNTKKGVDFLKLLPDDFMKFILRYIDFKDGIRLRKIKSLDDIDRAFWVDVAGALCDLKLVELDKCPQGSAGGCDQCDSCSVVVTPNLGNVLGRYNKFLESKSVSSVSFEYDIHEEWWKDVGKTVFEWGCCPGASVAML
jgi:hypothetical protein